MTASTHGARRAIRIVEHADTWRIHWTASTHEDAATAAEALASAKNMGGLIAETSGTSVLVIEWEPCSAIGRAVVRALQ